MIAVRRWGFFFFLIPQLLPPARTPFGLFPVFPVQLSGETDGGGGSGTTEEKGMCTITSQ